MFETFGTLFPSGHPCRFEPSAIRIRCRTDAKHPEKRFSALLTEGAPQLELVKQFDAISKTQNDLNSASALCWATVPERYASSGDRVSSVLRRSAARS
jgi:hypothetical protein